MNTSKHQIIVGSLVLVAFLWGYKRNSLESAFADLIASFSSSAADSPSAVSTAPTLAPGKLTTPERPVTPDPFGNAYKLVAGGRPVVNPEGPAAGNQGGAAPSPFAGNLDTIRSGEIKERQSVQRNAYFDKLSEQMKQLRGSQTIPEPPPPARTPEPVIDNPIEQPPALSPTERLKQQRADTPAQEIPGLTGAHPEFSTGTDEEDDSVDEELDSLDDELSDLEAAVDDDEDL